VAPVTWDRSRYYSFDRLVTGAAPNLDKLKFVLIYSLSSVRSSFFAREPVRLSPRRETVSFSGYERLVCSLYPPCRVIGLIYALNLSIVFDEDSIFAASKIFAQNDVQAFSHQVWKPTMGRRSTSAADSGHQWRGTAFLWRKSVCASMVAWYYPGTVLLICSLESSYMERRLVCGRIAPVIVHLHLSRWCGSFVDIPVTFFLPDDIPIPSSASNTFIRHGILTGAALDLVC